MQEIVHPGSPSDGAEYLVGIRGLWLKANVVLESELIFESRTTVAQSLCS